MSRDLDAARGHRAVLLVLCIVLALAPGGNAETSSGEAEAPSAGSSSAIVAEYRDGVVLDEDYRAWMAHRRPALDPSERGSKQARALRELVLLRVLEQRFQQYALGAGAQYAAWLRLLEEKEAVKRLRRQALDAAEPTEKQLVEAFERDRESFRRPARWRLQNLFKAVAEDAGEAERQAIRDELVELRQRVEQGEEFQALARQHSQSQTRRRGGRMGWVTLDQLQPVVAAAVAQLGSGEISKVLPVEGGWAILRCQERAEARVPELEQVRNTLRIRLRDQQFKLQWERSAEQLLEAAMPRYPWPAGPHGPVFGSVLDPQAVMVSFRSAEPRGRPADLSGLDLQFFQRDQGSGPISALSPQAWRRLLEQRALLALRAKEAARQSLLGDDAYRDSLGWKRRELHAELAIWHELGEPAPPKEEELRSAFAAKASELVYPELIQLRRLGLALHREMSATVVRRMEDWGQQLASRGPRSGGVPETAMTLEQAAESLAPQGELEDLGWMTRKQVFRFGLNAEHALAGLGAGEFTPAVQEGPKLYIYEVHGVKAQRPLEYAEARPLLLQQHRSQKRNEARRELRHSLLEEQKLRWVVGESSASESSKGESSQAGQ